MFVRLQANKTSHHIAQALELLFGSPTLTTSLSRTSYVGQSTSHVQIQDVETDSHASVDTLDIAIWSAVECGLAVTAGSLATLRPLFRLMSRKLGLKTACATKGLSGVPGLLSPGRMAPPSMALEKHSLAAVVLRPSSSSSPRSSLRESMFTSATPSVWTQHHFGHDERPSVTSEMLQHYELPARPASISPTLPRLSTGTWRFSREDVDDLEKCSTRERWTDIYRPK